VLDFIDWDPFFMTW
jgi:5-methyltetrahydrofolate--homocysteine methyltransferase